MKSPFDLLPIVTRGPLDADIDRFMASGRARGILQVPIFPTTAYGFFWTDCFHESGVMLQSLHYTKRGALQAMIKAQYWLWEDARSGRDSGLHLGRFRREDKTYRATRLMQKFCVRAVKIEQ